MGRVYRQGTSWWQFCCIHHSDKTRNDRNKAASGFHRQEVFAMLAPKAATQISNQGVSEKLIPPRALRNDATTELRVRVRTRWMPQEPLDRQRPRGFWDRCRHGLWLGTRTGGPCSSADTTPSKGLLLSPHWSRCIAFVFRSYFGEAKDQPRLRQSWIDTSLHMLLSKPQS